MKKSDFVLKILVKPPYDVLDNEPCIEVWYSEEHNMHGYMYDGELEYDFPEVQSLGLSSLTEGVLEFDLGANYSLDNTKQQLEDMGFTVVWAFKPVRASSLVPGKDASA